MKSYFKVSRPAATEWRSRPLLSFGLRFFVVVTPIAIGVGVVLALADLLHRPVHLPALLGWWLLISIAGFATLLLAERATRRLLPLAALLRLSLLFPDHAPARFALARRAVRPKQVLEHLERLGTDANSTDLKVVQRVLELTAALSVHDRATRGHSERVQVLTNMIAMELHLGEADRGRLRWAALLHDIGKLSVPPRILNKPAKPDPREWTILRRHPAEGARLVAPILPWLGVWGTAVEQHHEWFDGTGYPRHLKGSAISQAARIVAVADIFEVITAPRPYSRPVGVTKAREELVRVSGTQLDPAVVRALLNVSVGELWPVVGIGSILCQLPLVSQVIGLLGRAMPAWSGSTAATAAAGALLVVGINHPTEVRTPAPPPPRASQPTRVAKPPARSPAVTREDSSGPSAVASQPGPSPTPLPATSPEPTPTLTPPPVPTPTPLVQVLVQNVEQDVEGVTGALHQLGGGLLGGGLLGGG
jgi:HD-GYP domain-containing protein (c-di-GMP phosphodiesterase class II)